ncbi:MAG: hypothetical protein ACFFB5_00975 [Promethearchaeota archaeon]
MIPEDESLEFVIEHLKDMIQEQADKKIEKVSDLTDILSNFMATFLIVVDALISSSQSRFGAIDEKLAEFEDLLQGTSIKGLSEPSEISEKRPIEEKKQPIEESVVKSSKTPPIPSSDVVISPPPPPPPSPFPSITVAEEQKPVVETTEIMEDEITEDEAIETSEDMEEMEVEDLAAFAFQRREKKEKVPPSRQVDSGLSAGSLKLELMKELKKKFSSEKDTQNESN